MKSGNPAVAACRLVVSTCLAFGMPFAAAQTGAAETTSSAIAARYPAGSIKSVEDADKALADVARERPEVEARYAAEEQACHPKFFATSCIEQAQERRRKATMELRAVEIEANFLKRRSRVEARDKALEEKSVKADAESAEQARKQAEAVRTMPDAAGQEIQARTTERAARKVKINEDTDRQARHDAKMARIRADEAAKSKERAEKVADYERKVQAAKARQEEIAKRKAEKEQKRSLKQSAVPAAQ